MNNMTWLEVCEDKSLRDLPYKIETNRWGQIIMSPVRWEHGFFQGLLVRFGGQYLPTWRSIVECPIETVEGVKVPDVAFCSPDFFSRIRGDVSLEAAPEICVEVLSDSNTEEEMLEKKSLYFSLGASEVWICSEVGHLTFFSPTSQLQESKLCPQFPQRLESVPVQP